MHKELEALYSLPFPVVKELLSLVLRREVARPLPLKTVSAYLSADTKGQERRARWILPYTLKLGRLRFRSKGIRRLLS